MIDDKLRTSDHDIFAIGEVALHRSMIYGLVAPGYDMADMLAANLCGADRKFSGADLVEETAGILGYQVIRAGPRRLRVRVDEAHGFDRARVCDDLLLRLREYLSSVDLGSVVVELAGERPVREPSGGKLRQFYDER